jgi:glycosyltransferase involved in cell wall biosynthesis
MRVVHISTHDLTGGAARSAWCLHRGLLGIGVESCMLVRSKLSDDPAVTGANDAACAILHEQALTPYILRRLPSGSPWFTSGVIDVDISSHPSVQSADVLHLHWVAEWLSAGVIKKLVSLGKPIIWSLHDLWPVTCGNHYPGTNDPRDESWQTGESLPEPLIEIGRSEFQRKRSLLADQQIHVVAPSRWIGRMSQRSIIGSKWPVKIVPYGIETRVFCPSDQGEARALWNLPTDKVLLLFGCSGINEFRKGFHVLTDALRAAAPDPDKVALVVFGEGNPDLPGIPVAVHHVGRIDSESAMASLYASADAYLCPTLEDNLPNTVIESLACGTPVIGFITGGVPDLVADGENGLLTPCGDVPALAACLKRFNTDATMRHRLQAAARSADKSVFAIQTQARRCLELYLELTGYGDTATMKPSSVSAELQGWNAAMDFVPGESPWILLAVAEALKIASQREELSRNCQNKANSGLGIPTHEAARRKAKLGTTTEAFETVRGKSWRAWLRRIIGI